MRYRFADTSLDTQRYELQRVGVFISLPPKVYQVLAYLWLREMPQGGRPASGTHLYTTPRDRW